jgi:hypothetical protein
LYDWRKIYSTPLDRQAKSSRRVASPCRAFVARSHASSHAVAPFAVPVRIQKSERSYPFFCSAMATHGDSSNEIIRADAGT